ncbi:MAG: 16S rRNA (guanine(527)-N(7))-methyltransferase RsmG [Acidobacteriota bacterium]
MAARDFRTRLARRAGKSGLFLGDELVERLTAYYELLSHWNRKINLTALDDPDAAIDRLLLEPVIAVRHFPSPDVRVMDVGSGGGSPAIPMKLAVPGATLTMVEVKARKSAFLREAIRVLDLDNTTVETTRYEELLVRPELHEAFGLLSLRAVRVEVRTLFTLQAFIRPGGLLFMFRGPTGSEAPPSAVPPLSLMGTFPLVESLQSRLTVLQKRSI